MAGEVGIEPTNAGIKIRCLTTWRLPSGNLSMLARFPLPLRAGALSFTGGSASCESAPGTAAGAHELKRQTPAAGVAPVCAPRCRDRPRAAGRRPFAPGLRRQRRQRHRRRNRSCAAPGSRVRHFVRHSIRPPSARMRRSRRPRPENCRSHGLQIVAAITLGKDVYFRRRRRTCQFCIRENRAVGTRTSGQASAIQSVGARHWRQPLADAASHRGLAADEERHVGAQGCADARPARYARQCERPQSRFSPSSTLAASLLPPPSPPPCGTRFSMATSTPFVQPVAAASARAAANAQIVVFRHARHATRAGATWLRLAG